MNMDEKQNETFSAFAMLFHDLVFNLTQMFPECTATKNFLNITPTAMDIIKQDWLREITPYNIKGFKYAGHYFERIRAEVDPNHVFNKLLLLEKFKLLDADSKEELCSLLSDLEMFACEKAGSGGMRINKITKSRFADPKLHEMCVKELGDRKLAEELRTICSNNMDFNKMYENKTNDQIVQQLKSTKPFLPLFIKLVKSNALPMKTIIKFMEKKTNQKKV